MVKNSPSNAGNSGSMPGRGTKTPQAKGQLSLHAATREDRLPQQRPRAPPTSAKRTVYDLVVMYGCESWTTKKAKCQRIDAFNCGVGQDS